MAVPVLAFLFFGRELTSGFFDVAWAPDGQRLAYTTDAGLWVVPADGSQVPRRLLGEQVEGVQWAPDGRSVAFTCGQQPGVSLGVVDAAGGPARELADIDPYRVAYAWAPDAGTIAFVGPFGDVSVVEAATGRSRVLISMAGSPGLVVGPAWSGDASTVILAGAHRGGGEGIWAITADNGEQHLVWPGPTSDMGSSLAVEPGAGGRIAFQQCTDRATDDPADPFQQECTWYLMQLDGSGLKQLDKAPPWADADTGAPRTGVYSPDGRLVARVHGSGTDSELWVDSVDGSSHVVLAER
jgi:Tol biopolymer transport system component